MSSVREGNGGEQERQRGCGRGRGTCLQVKSSYKNPFNPTLNGRSVNCWHFGLGSAWHDDGAGRRGPGGRDAAAALYNCHVALVVVVLVQDMHVLQRLPVRVVAEVHSPLNSNVVVAGAVCLLNTYTNSIATHCNLFPPPLPLPLQQHQQLDKYLWALGGGGGSSVRATKWNASTWELHAARAEFAWDNNNNISRARGEGWYRYTTWPQSRANMQVKCK